MNRTFNTHRGENYYQNDQLLFVNRYTENFSLPMHDHDFYEFCYVAEGNGFHYVDDDVQEAHKGHLFFIPLGTTHVFRPVSTDKNKHPLIVYNCVFSPQLLSTLGNYASDPNITMLIASIFAGQITAYSLADPDDSIGKLFASLHREFSLPRLGSTDYMNTLLLQILIVAHRLQSQPRPATLRTSTHFDQLLSYIENNLVEKLSLGHLSQISSWSERHLQRLFLQHTSQSFKSYLQSVRIQRSCELLRETPLKISAVAKAVGYRDFASFIAVFKRNTGCTPSAYRKAYGENVVDDPS